MFAGNVRGSRAAVPGGMGGVDACSRGGRAGLHGSLEIPCDGCFASRTVADDASFDCGIAAARGEAALLDFELASGGVAGEDQLRSVFVAAAVCVREASSASVFCGGRGGDRVRFILSGGAAHVAGAGKEGETGEEDGISSGGLESQGLKPFSAVRLAARLKPCPDTNLVH